MGMRPYGILAYGVYIDDEKIYEMIGDKYEEGFWEFMDDKWPNLNYLGLGSDVEAGFFIGPMDSSYESSDWGEVINIHNLFIPIKLEELDKFCNEYDIKKDYKWRLGAYFG